MDKRKPLTLMRPVANTADLKMGSPDPLAQTAATGSLPKSVPDRRCFS